MKRPDADRRPSVRPPAPPSGDREQPTEPVRIVSSLRVRTEAEPSAPERTSGRIAAARAALAGVRVPDVRLPGAENRAVKRAERERRRFERGEVRRFTQRSRRRRRIALVVAGSLVALALIVGIAAFSPLMAVRTIEITGTQRVDAATVQGALDDQLGVPLTLVDRGRSAACSAPTRSSRAIPCRPGRRARW